MNAKQKLEELAKKFETARQEDLEALVAEVDAILEGEAAPEDEELNELWERSRD